MRPLLPMRLRDLKTLVTAQSRWPDVRVACVWLPHLPLRVEVLRRPALDGQPLVLGSGPGERKVVTLCSPEAEAAGIYPGLPLREVLPLCREAVVLPPDPVRVAAARESVAGELARVSHAVQADEEDVFLDLRGLERLYGGDLERLSAAIRAAVPPLLRPRIGFGSGPFAAAVAARVAPQSGQRVVPVKGTARFLAPLSVEYLPLEPEAQRRLDLLGIRTIGDLAALPFAAVQAQFGPAGARAWSLARGKDDTPIVPQPPVLTAHASLRFEDPLASVDAVMVAVDHLLATAFADPALQGHSVRQALLRALLSDGTSWERLITFKEAVSTRDAARRGLRAKLELPNALPPAPLEEMFLELTGLGGIAGKQGSLFSARAHQESQIAEAARQLRARFGLVPLYHAVEVEPWSRIPERRWALVPSEL